MCYSSQGGKPTPGSRTVPNSEYSEMDLVSFIVLLLMWVMHYRVRAVIYGDYRQNGDVCLNHLFPEFLCPTISRTHFSDVSIQSDSQWDESQIRSKD